MKNSSLWTFLPRAGYYIRAFMMSCILVLASISSASATSTPSDLTANRNSDVEAWINSALQVLQEKGIPGSFEGIYRNLMRESSGDPMAINLWDINAKSGTPSKGLMQVIDPTFQAYHVAGTSWDIYDPVANIAAACNYAAQRYGSIDNVNGPY
ncbi:transglycosylase SLT domain-containing protein [Streptomyces xanthophaeus]|uniref:transglycosylase SLT domain-containing protein n=1 Tax=Streptomyces xanthophaeus TaxID=67385 RepID=UPI0036D1FC6C